MPAPDQPDRPQPEDAPAPDRPGLPQPEDAPAAPADPWAPPDPARLGANTPAAGPAPYPAVPSWNPAPGGHPRNDQGVVAMVLGIVGMVLSLFLFLFWLAWLPALLALVFGCVGLGLARRGLATNRPMALTGVVLGIAGLLVSLASGIHVAERDRTAARERAAARQQAADARAQQQQEAADKLHQAQEQWQKTLDEQQKKAAEEQQKRAAEQQKKAADERARHLSFGGTYTYPDGVQVTLGRPTPYTPQRNSWTELPDDATFVQLRLTVVNTGTADADLQGAGLMFVKDAKGALLYPTGGQGEYTFLPHTLHPGQTATHLESYGIPNTTGNPFTVEYAYGPTSDYKTVVWTGSAH